MSDELQRILSVQYPTADPDSLQQSVAQIKAILDSGPFRSALTGEPQAQAISYFAATFIRRLDILNSTRGMLYAPEVATASGTAFDVVDIPENVSEIQIGFKSVSLSGTDSIVVQIGDSGGVVASGYDSSSTRTGISPAATPTGFHVPIDTASAAVRGCMTLFKQEPSLNLWGCRGMLQVTGTTMAWVAGFRALSGMLDRVRVTRSGSNSFDGGAFTVGWRY